MRNTQTIQLLAARGIDTTINKTFLTQSSKDQLLSPLDRSSFHSYVAGCWLPAVGFSGACAGPRVSSTHTQRAAQAAWKALLLRLRKKLLLRMEAQAQ